MIVALFCFVTSTRVVAILDFANMAAPGVVRIGAHQKSKKYGLGKICVKFGVFGLCPRRFESCRLRSYVLIVRMFLIERNKIYYEYRQINYDHEHKYIYNQS